MKQAWKSGVAGRSGYNAIIQGGARTKAYDAGVRVGSHFRNNIAFPGRKLVRYGPSPRGQLANFLGGMRREPSYRSKAFLRGYGVGRGLWDSSKHPRDAEGKFT